MEIEEAQREERYTYPEKRRWRKDAHHFRPRSRGGDDSKENEGWFGADHARTHRAFHALFTNLEPPEIVYLILYAPRCVYDLKTRHPQYWNTVFGKANPLEAIEIIRSRFGGPFQYVIGRIVKMHWYTGEVPKTWEEAVKETPHGGDFASDGIDAFFLADDWITLFDHMGVYAVAVLLLYSWITACPHEEVKHSHTNETRLAKRIESWNRVFGAFSTQERALEALESIAPNRQKAIKDAIKLARIAHKNTPEKERN